VSLWLLPMATSGGSAATSVAPLAVVIRNWDSVSELWAIVNYSYTHVEAMVSWSPCCQESDAFKHFSEFFCDVHSAIITFGMMSSVLAATASLFAALLIRRRLRMSAAVAAWHRVAAVNGLPNAPPHHVRVAITGYAVLMRTISHHQQIRSGVSSGVGRACVKLLSK
jgi:hypothetical protein